MDSRTYESSRTISPIVHASKLVLQIMQKRLEPYLEREIPDERGVFRKNRGSRNQIAESRKLIKVKVKLRFSAPSAGIAEIEQT